LEADLILYEIRQDPQTHPRAQCHCEAQCDAAISFGEGPSVRLDDRDCFIAPLLAMTW
jgi:hypothetical protein